MAIKEECERLGITLLGLSAAYNFLIMHKTKNKYLPMDFLSFLCEMKSEVQKALCTKRLIGDCVVKKTREKVLFWLCVTKLGFVSSLKWEHQHSFHS